MTRRYITDEEGERIVALYYNGLSFSEIGRCVGRNRHSVRCYLIRLGEYEFMDTGKTQRIAGALEWYKRGYPLMLIVRHFHIDEGTIYNNLHRRGIPLRSSYSGKARSARPGEVAQ